MVTNASPQEVQDWLEWAGSKFLSMGITSPKPQGTKVFWPEYAQDARTAYGYTGERLRPAQPTSYEIELMDKILLFPNMIKDINSRRTVSARMMVAPISGRYIYSWDKIAFMLHANRRTVKRLHYLGILTIASNLTQDKTYALRQLLSPPPTKT